MHSIYPVEFVVAPPKANKGRKESGGRSSVADKNAFRVDECFPSLWNPASLADNRDCFVAVFYWIIFNG